MNNSSPRQDPPAHRVHEAAEAVRILVADDHPLVREAVAQLIGEVPAWQVCGFAADGAELIEQGLRLRPDVIVLDLHMPGFEGVEAVRDLKKQLPSSEIVIFTAARSEGVLQELFDAGVKSFIGKNENSESLKAAIASAAAHEAFLTPRVSRSFVASLTATTPGIAPVSAQLTRREREIIRHIAEGRANKDIAAALDISSRTAETHRAAILRKLGLSSTAEIVRYAIRNGMIEA